VTIYFKKKILQSFLKSVYTSLLVYILWRIPQSNQKSMQASKIDVSSLLGSDDASPPAAAQSYLSSLQLPVPIGLQVLPGIQEPAAADAAPVGVAVCPLEYLTEIQTMLNGVKMFKEDDAPRGLRDTAHARNASEAWTQACTALEAQYCKMMRQLIPGYVLPWRLPCSTFLHNRKSASRVLFIQLMVAEILEIAEIVRFNSTSEGLWGIDRVYVRLENLPKFESMPIPIPQRGICSRVRKSINCVLNRAGFDVAKKCVHNNANCVVLRFDVGIVDKNRSMYAKSASPVKSTAGPVSPG
jgi:hypothetical protein